MGSAADTAIPDDLGIPQHEEDVHLPRELAVVLRDLRRSLMEHAAIRDSVRELRSQVSVRDLIVSFGCVFVGVFGQAYAVSTQPLLIPVCFVSILIGYSGLYSLSHESWHRRSHSSRNVDGWLSRWAYSGFLVGDNEVHRADHRLHHRYAGEAGDPNSVTWKIPPREFARHLAARLLILPTLYIALKALLTGQRGDQAYEDDRHRASPRLLLAIAIVHAPWALGLLWVSPWAFLFGYLFPLSVAAAMARLREYREHALLSDGTTAVFDSRCNEIERLIIPGGFFNYHALHHLFPEIPQRALPVLYRVIDGCIDMSTEYYGISPQVGLKRSYLNDRVVAPSSARAR